MKQSFHLKIKKLDIQDGEKLIVVLNEQEAWEHGINAFDKVEIRVENTKFVANADISKHYVRTGTIGIFQDAFKKYNLNEGDLASVHFTKRDNLSVQAVRKKMQGKSLTYKEIYSVIKDIAENKLTDILITYYVASSFFNKTSDKETYLTAKAMAKTGINFKYPKLEIVADKHCIGGVPGNETTMIIIPLLASLGVKMPKNFSKAITSPAATGECVSVLMNIIFDKKGIINLIKKNNSCLVRGGGLDLAPADDRIIKVSYPLSIQNSSKVVASILAKKYAMGITHSLIDIPMGPSAKVKNTTEATLWKKQFEKIGKLLGMKMSVQITEAKQPIGAGIGATLQVREVLRVLQQHKLRPMDLEEKSVFLASKIIENVGLAKGKQAYKLAYGQLISGKVRKKMQDIIKSQDYKTKSKYFSGNARELDSEELYMAKHSHTLKAKKSGTVKCIDMKLLNIIARTLGAPHDLQAGLYLNKKLGEKIKKGDVVYTLYANHQSKIKAALDMIDDKDFYEF